MKFEEIQNAWQHQGEVGRVNIESDALLKLVRRNHKTMEGILLRRDFIEVAIALGLIPVWIWMGIAAPLLWTWYLVIPGLLWIAGFLIVDRRIQKRKRPQPGDCLRDSIEQSLVQIRHQIHLLKNILKWYLLPVAVPLAIYTLHKSWLDREGWGMASELLFFGLVFWGIYELNQWAIRKNLKPQLEELQELLDSFDRPETEDGALETERNDRS